ncbi:MAG: hypothetical protein R3223_00995 [Longimicrobiales bacterium]|nr:hypothetical protein [Longimicrobiales bacterium]
MTTPSSSPSSSSPSEDRPPPEAASSSGSRETTAAGDASEPNTVGTLFIMILFLMALAGMWGIMYLMLLER